MSSIRLKFRASKDANKAGSLYYQVIHNREVRQVRTDYHIYQNEWDAKAETLSDFFNYEGRTEILRLINDNVKWDIRVFKQIDQHMKVKLKIYTANDLIQEFCSKIIQKRTFIEYMHEQIVRLKKLGRVRSSENCQTTMNSFMRFRKGEDFSFDRMDKELIEDYEAYLKKNGIKRNSSSFYLRNLRMIYNQAVEQGLTHQTHPFKKVYTGIDKTIKRAISIDAIRCIKELDLTNCEGKDFARDMFMMSFYLRGMSFIDMAFLKKKDLSNGVIIYSRHKTGQQLIVKWENHMQKLLDKYPPNPTQYLLPIIMIENLTERDQYLKSMATINRGLKSIGKMANLSVPLTMYVARHSWASIARGKNVSLSVISEGMGHDSETTTQIYLASIKTTLVDNANRMILNDL